MKEQDTTAAPYEVGELPIDLQAEGVNPHIIEPDQPTIVQINY